MIKKIDLQIKSFLQYSSLLRELVVRDIKIRYRRSALGLIWTILNPLLMMVVITIVFSTIFKQDIPNFPIYYLSGSLIFSFNTEATTEAMYSIIGNASLIKKIYIPKYLFPISKILSGLINLGFSFVAMIIVMIVTRAPFHPTLLLLPVLVFYTFLFATGLGMFLSAVAVRFRDLCHFYGVFTMAWIYFTPIFYPAERLPAYALAIMKFNPMYHYVGYSRDIVVNGIVPSAMTNLYCITFGVIALIVGSVVFYKSQDNFVLYV